MRKLTFGIVIFIALAALGSRILSEGEGASKAVFVFYLEILEENKDTFPAELFNSSRLLSEDTLSYREGTIELNPGIPEAIAKGEAEPRFRLIQFPKPFELSKVVLCVRHKVSFTGRGRDAVENFYYLIEGLPAKIALRPYEGVSGEVVLDFLNPMEGLLGLRFPEKDLEIAGETQSDPGKVLIRCQGRQYLLMAGQEIGLGENSKGFRIKQKVLGEVPLGPVEQKEIQTKTVDWGEITFSTALRIRFEGKGELVWGDRR